MSLKPTDNTSSNSTEIHKTYPLNHIELPYIHPNPRISIELLNYISQLLISNDNLFHQFEDHYKTLDVEKQYFLLKYTLEHLYPYTYYPNFIQTYFKRIAEQSEQNATVLKDRPSQRVILNDYSLYQHVDEELDKTEQAEQIIEFVREQLPYATYNLRLQYRDLLQGQDYTFAPEHFAIDNDNLDPKIYQVNVPQHLQPFLDEIRNILMSKVQIEQIDAFIFNSFNFPSNFTKMELLSLDFGNSETTNTLIHKVYLLFKNIVKKKTSRFDFAKIMYLNFEFVRDNWKKYCQTKEKQQKKDNNLQPIILEDYLKNRVASNIEK